MPSGDGDVLSARESRTPKGNVFLFVFVLAPRRVRSRSGIDLDLTGGIPTLRAEQQMQTSAPGLVVISFSATKKLGRAPHEAGVEDEVSSSSQTAMSESQKHRGCGILLDQVNWRIPVPVRFLRGLYFSFFYGQK